MKLFYVGSLRRLNLVNFFSLRLLGFDLLPGGHYSQWALAPCLSHGQPITKVNSQHSPAWLLNLAGLFSR